MDVKLVTVVWFYMFDCVKKSALSAIDLYSISRSHQRVLNFFYSDWWVFC